MARLRLALGAALLLLVPHCALAAPKKQQKPEPAPVATCRGADMMAELATSDPVLHARIMAEASATENASALLWKVEQPGSKAPPSHLFGTVHLTDERIAKLPPAARKALDRAATVVLEVADLSRQASQNALSSAMRLAIFTDGNSLEKLVTREEFEAVRQTVSKVGLPADTARHLRPWIVSMLLSGTDCERKKLEDGGVVLDMRIAEVARRRNVPMVSLETIDGQLEALAAVPEAEQLDMLRAGLAYASRSSDLVETTLQFYLKRNLGGVWPFQMALAEKAGIKAASFAGLQQELIAKRNARMLERALPHLAKGGTFMAVGALHIPGKSGLVALLRQAGYTVTPVE